MLSKEENEMLTRVGPGTPCGELMRRYWHPVAATVQLADNPVRKVRILGGGPGALPRPQWEPGAD